MKLKQLKKKISEQTSPGPNGITGEFYQTFREELKDFPFSNNSLKNCRRKNASELIVWSQYHFNSKYGKYISI